MDTSNGLRPISGIMAGKKTVNVLVIQVLDVESPEELFLVESYNPSDRTMGITAKGPLGFGGADTVIALMLPIIYKFFDTLMDEIFKDAAKDLVKRIKTYVLSRPENQLQADAEHETLVTLVREELELAGLDISRSSSVANTVLDALVKNKYLLAK